MANSIEEIFNHEDKKLRTMNENGEIWFSAIDVCKMLGIVNARTAVIGLDDSEKTVHTVNSITKGNPNRLFVNESGLWSLVLKSRKKEARDFAKWITSEVIPSIRKTGGYQLSQKKEDLSLVEFSAHGISNQQFIAQIVASYAQVEQKLSDVDTRLESIEDKLLVAEKKGFDKCVRMLISGCQIKDLIWAQD